MYYHILVTILFALVLATQATGNADDHPDGRADDRAHWPSDVTRPWIGPAFWANPMMDWRLRRGRLECHVSGVNHDVHWMTRCLRRPPLRWIECAWKWAEPGKSFNP